MNELIINRVSNTPGSGITDGMTLLDLSRGWLKQGNPIVALELLKDAIVSPEAQQDQELRAQILKETGRAKMMQSDWENAESAYLEAQNIFYRSENFKGASECARNRANMYFQKGSYKKAEELVEQALNWASETGNYELRATILNTLGAIKSVTGDWRESIKIFKLCLADFESSGNQIRQGYVLLNIGLSQTELSEYNEAINSLNEALAIALEVKDLNLVEICYQNISKCYLSQNETHLAKSVIDTARKILPGLNSKALETELNIIDCKILRIMGNTEKAEKLLKEAYQTATENKLTALEADILFEQALVEKEKGNYELAVSKMNAVVKQYKTMGMEKGLKDAIQYLNQMKKKVNA